jgi:hypothetical protein
MGNKGIQKDINGFIEIVDMEQRSREWFLARLGKITASEISCLMKNHKRAMKDEELAAFKAANPKSRVTTVEEAFSDATFTYLNRKVMENYLPINSKDTYSQNCIDEYIEIHSTSSAATRYGTDIEPMARERYAEIMGYEVYETGFVPYEKYPKLVGGSPDGLIREEIGIIEIKSPFSLEKHMQHFLYECQDDLKENEEDYYWQCVGNMLFTDTTFCDFISFSPYVGKSKQIKVLRIQRRDEEIKLLEERIGLAVDYIREKITQLNNIQMIIK